MARIGLVVNPAAGRDIRRLTGGASVTDNYAKRRVAECVLSGLNVTDDPPSVTIMPDRSGISDHLIDEASKTVDVEALDIPITQSAEDTQRAGERFREEADCIVVLGGDGTTRDMALECGDVPLVSVATGTNTVVPTAIDGTVAGAAAALLATGCVSLDETTIDHGMVEAVADTTNGEKRLKGLATLGVLDVEFVGTRAILDAESVVGGVVSRAFPSEIGLSGLAGALATHRPEEPGGVGFRLGPADETSQTVRAITVPGVVDRFGVSEWRELDSEESMTFELSSGVLSIDGERELELQNSIVEIRPVDDGPRLVDIERVFAAGTAEGVFTEDSTRFHEER
ncbi:MAG: NAD(+)/NADH kinase [Euryarchaeota archaeon]|nr:NAD(+)/NADH kinase [Euryarchaeota archaeon]